MEHPSILKSILILASAAVLLAAMHFAASFLVPVLLGLFFATLLTPIYGWLKRRTPGALALLLSIGLLVLLALFIFNEARTKNPMVPPNIMKSQRVGAYMSHDDTRKSRCSDVTMMTKRSSHMPTLTMRERMNSHVVLLRSFFDHIVCGIRPLQKISAQYDQAYGP